MPDPFQKQPKKPLPINLEHETWSFKVMLYFGLFYFMFGCLAFSDLWYSLFSHTTEGRVTRAELKRSVNDGDGSMYLFIEYQFQDGEASRVEFAKLSGETHLVPSDKVVVEYFSGQAHSARIKGEGGIASYAFAVLTLILIGWIYWIGWGEMLYFKYFEKEEYLRSRQTRITRIDE